MPVEGRVPVLPVVSGDDVLADRAWAYPTPYPTAIERVGRDSGYVAFWKEVEVTA